MTQKINGLQDIINQYKAFILDAWGVLHNGKQPFNHVIACLKKLKAHQKKILILSNSPRPIEVIQKGLNDLGITSDLYDHIHSSGQELMMTLQEEKYKKYGFYHIGEEDHRILFEKLDLHRRDNLHEANMIINTGMNRKEFKIEKIHALLSKAYEKKMPMICANPDLFVKNGADYILCAGSIAAAYQEIGGTVTYFGKPHLNVYKRAHSFLNEAVKDVIAIGDSFATDIKGANNNGIDSIIVRTGVHGEKFDVDALSATYKAAPTYIMPELKY